MQTHGIGAVFGPRMRPLTSWHTGWTRWSIANGSAGPPADDLIAAAGLVDVAVMIVPEEVYAAA